MKVHSSVTREQAKEVEELVKQCMRLLRKKEYELNMPTNCWQKALDVLEIKNRKNSPSRAGAHAIQINLGYWQFGNQYHTEYKRFNEDPCIGKIKVTSRHDHLMVMIAHEIAHHVQYRYCPRVNRFKGKWSKPHGDCFQTIYMYLRRDLVNPTIKAKY
jgi:hypothetical protein